MLLLKRIFLTSNIGVFDKYTKAYSKKRMSPMQMALTTSDAVNLLEVYSS